MIVLDTNVVSEPLRADPAPQVQRWLDAHDIGVLHLTTITLAEVRYGIAALPDGKRKRSLADRFEDEVVPRFAGRILPFDEPASAQFARMQAAARAQGREMGSMDALIAAICLGHGFALATRNVSDFIASGVRLIDPWEG